jgi:hypothetical protein
MILFSGWQAFEKLYFFEWVRCLFEGHPDQKDEREQKFYQNGNFLYKDIWM